MLRTIKVLASLLAAAPLVVFLACSSSSGGGACTEGGGADGGTCMPGSTPAYTSCADLTTPTVSFATDIQPIFNQSCGLSTPGTCHALQQPGNATPWLVYLGSFPNPSSVDAGQVLEGIVGQPAFEDPSMSIIKAGDPDNSYLMHKLDYDQCQFSTACNGPNLKQNPLQINCGSGMPYLSGTLCLDSQTPCVRGQTITTQYGERDQIRRWIAQGAKNN